MDICSFINERNHCPTHQGVLETPKGGDIIEQEITISYSRVSSYLHCPEAHYLGYVEKISPKAAARPLSFGSDFHKLLEHRITPEKVESIREEIRDTYYELPAKQQTVLGENYLDDVFEIFEDYQQVWEGSDEPLQTEVEFKIPIAKYKGSTVYFHGIIDEVYEDALCDHKTFNQKPDLSTLVMNQQLLLYVKAHQILTGKLVSKIKWDYIKSTPAQRPVWLSKSKRFSEAASTRITPYSWLRACKEHGIKDEEILKKANMWWDNVPNYFIRHEVDVIPEMVETVWENFKATVKDILVRGDTNRVMNITRDCSWCNYRPICYARFTGSDVEHVKKVDFMTKKSRKKK